jgi:hypothetical protein
MAFQKGVSGNPGGRPKRDWSWASELEKAVNETEKQTGKTFRELVAKRVVAEAASGNINAIKELINRMDGFPLAYTDITSEGEKLEGIIIYKPEKNARDMVSEPKTGDSPSED